jgi:acetylornithine deacetylase/succinyl-diaminopimelate desuccinylase-like protein
MLSTVALIAVLQLAVPVSTGQLTADVTRLAGQQTNEARFDALTGLLNERKIPFTVERFALDKPVGREPRVEGRNVVASFGEGAEHVIVGAHYDAARLPDGSLSAGAVDNAASSVLLVHLAERLRAQPPRTRITLVWFDMEELGLIGSRRYVQAHASDHLAAMLNLDINAYGDTILFGPSTRAESAQLRRRLLETCAAENVPCVAFPQMPPGDDRSFVQHGTPTLSLATVSAVEAHQVWLMMNAGPGSGLA